MVVDWVEAVVMRGEVIETLERNWRLFSWLQGGSALALSGGLMMAGLTRSWCYFVWAQLGKRAALFLLETLQFVIATRRALRAWRHLKRNTQRGRALAVARWLVCYQRAPRRLLESFCTLILLALPLYLSSQGGPHLT